jgi:hypothetical protein
MRKSDLLILAIFVLIVFVIGFIFSYEEFDGLVYSFNPVGWLIELVMDFFKMLFELFFG